MRFESTCRSNRMKQCRANIGNTAGRKRHDHGPTHRSIRSHPALLTVSTSSIIHLVSRGSANPNA